MATVFVVDREQEWFEVRDATVLSARDYLAQPDRGGGAGVRVVNLCRTGRYQGRGYYVSLLAEARGQRPLPDVKTVEDLKSEARIEALARELDAAGARHACTMTRASASSSTSISARIRRSAMKRWRRSCSRACARRCCARCSSRAEGGWRLDAVEAIGIADIPAQHRAFLLQAARAFAVDAQGSEPRRAGTARPRLAILRDPNEPHKPSNDEALQQLVRIAPLVGLEAELIGPDALERLPEFDALFNRASPDVDGITYEFVRRAESLGMPVVDDPESILKCLNKVYMHELMSRHRIAQPRTLIVQRDNVDQVVPTLGLPCVLKLPDSGFGLDVVKIESEDDLRQRGGALLQDLGADRRAGVAADRLRLARRRLRRAAPVRRQVLHGAGPLEDHRGRRQGQAHGRGQDGGDGDRRGARAGDRHGGARRQPDRPRPVRRRPEAGRRPRAT